MGGLGYNKRVAKVISVLPLISWVTITDTSHLDKDWQKVNEELNPFNLK